MQSSFTQGVSVVRLPPTSFLAWHAGHRLAWNAISLMCNRWLYMQSSFTQGVSVVRLLQPTCRLFFHDDSGMCTLTHLFPLHMIRDILLRVEVLDFIMDSSQIDG